MDSRRDPYDEKYGAVVNTSRAGQVTVTVADVAVTEPRRAGWEAEDEQRALFIALEAARFAEGSRISEAESERARAEWKAAAYAKHAADEPKNRIYAEKAVFWQGERDRLKARDTKSDDVKGGRE